VQRFNNTLDWSYRIELILQGRLCLCFKFTFFRLRCHTHAKLCVIATRKEKNYFCRKLLNVVARLYSLECRQLEECFSRLCVRDSNICCKKLLVVVKSLFPPGLTQGVLNLSSFVIKGTMFDDIANELNGRMRIDRYAKRRGLTRMANVAQF